MRVLERILESLPKEKTAISHVMVGAHWTLVCSRFCGLASTLLPDEPHGSSSVRDVGKLHLKDAQTGWLGAFKECARSKHWYGSHQFAIGSR
jgi:hypothetical protein